MKEYVAILNQKYSSNSNDTFNWIMCSVKTKPLLRLNETLWTPAVRRLSVKFNIIYLFSGITGHKASFAKGN